MSLLAAPLLAAEPGPLAEVKSAVATLGNQTNYSWKTTVEVPANARFRPGPTEGWTEKGGYTVLTMNFGDNVSEAVLKGTNGALKTADSGWQSLAEAAKGDGGGGGFNPTLFLARTLQNYKTPAVQAVELATAAKSLNRDTNGISGELTEDGAKTLLTFRPRNGEGPAVSNARGSVKFRIADGKLAGYQFHVQGTVTFNGNSRDADRTTTVEIKGVNTTKIAVPDEAKKLLP